MMGRFPGSPRVDRKSLNELKRNLEVLSPSGFCLALVMVCSMFPCIHI